MLHCSRGASQGRSASARRRQHDGSRSRSQPGGVRSPRRSVANLRHMAHAAITPGGRLNKNGN